MVTDYDQSNYIYNESCVLIQVHDRINSLLKKGIKPFYLRANAVLGENSTKPQISSLHSHYVILVCDRLAYNAMVF